MKMLLYRPGEKPVETDVEASVESLAQVLGTDQYEWMTVRMLGFCVIHDPDGKAEGKPLNRLLGMTPLYGDFLVCGIDWDDNGNTRATPISVRLRSLLIDTIFNKIPTTDDLTDQLPSYAKELRAKQARAKAESN